jgi:site-specific DNA-cytosine methylase
MRETTGLPRQLDCPDSPRYRALGNAVTVNVAEWIGRRITEVAQ